MVDIDKLTKERKEHNYAVFFAYAPIIRGRLRKIGIKEKSVFLDAIDAIGDFIKYKIIVLLKMFVFIFS
nr:hypothetical protein [Borreliella bissettiae]